MKIICSGNTRKEAINRIKQAIDTIKDASINDKINSEIESRKFINSLTSSSTRHAKVCIVELIS